MITQEFEETIFRKEKAYIKNGETLKCMGVKLLDILSEKPNQLMRNEEIIPKLCYPRKEVDKYTLATLRIHTMKLRGFLTDSGSKLEVYTILGNNRMSQGMMLFVPD